MAASDKELELQLMESGNRLVEPPSSVDELISLLDQVESFLSRVEQSPSESMQNALSPSLKSLVAEQLFRHPDEDVKVAVAACISEITRITAPDAPYDDDQMREVFQLIVSSFENLSDKSSRSFIKRTSILETVAKVRSCVVMLDLECDALIIEMFQHFLKAIRDYHAEAVFTSMVTIMTLVLEESEDIPVEMLSPILACVKKDNVEVLPVAWKLAERVLDNCASKVKPYLAQAVEKSGISFHDYSSVVASICEATTAALEQNDAATEKPVDDKDKPAEAPQEKAAQDEKDKPPEAPQEKAAQDDKDKPADAPQEKASQAEAPQEKAAQAEAPQEKAAQEDKEVPEETISTEQVDLANETESVVSNGIVQTAEDNSLAEPNSLKKQDNDHLADKSENADTLTVAEPDGMEVEKVVNPDSKSEQNTQEKGRKSDSKSTEPSNSSHVNEKEVETLVENKSDSKDDTHSANEDPSVVEAVSSENKKETDVQHPSPKAAKDESTDVASPTPSGTIPDESHSKRAARPKGKESLIKETTPSVDDVSKKASEGISDSEAKTNRRSGKKVATVVSNEDNVSSDVDEANKESHTTSDSEEKSLKQLSKKVDSSGKNADGSSSKKLEDKKRRARGKVIPEKDGTKISTKNDDEEMVASPKSVKPSKNDSHMEETPKTNPKRKQHTPSKEKASDSLEYGENLVGLKVKVWWPKDRAFYEGVIHSFDSVKKKHKVNYIDGDQEILNLKREKWEVIENESGSDEEEAADHPNPDSSSEMPQKKKAKMADQPSKKVKMDASPKRDGGASSGKSKGAASKSGRKTKEDGKGDGKSKDGSKSVSKSDNENAAKVKDHPPKSGSKSVDVASKVGNKSKDDGSVTPKASTKMAKSKQETPKISSNSKGKPVKSAGKFNANGTGKSKSGSSKVKESESKKENSTDSAKVVESAKRKSSSSSKAQGSDSKSGKKRRR